MHTYYAVPPTAPGYPARLMQVKRAPVLQVLGQLDVLQRPCVAVVGARAASAAAMSHAFACGKALAEAGYCVVSGGALGVDGAAHRGALAAGGVTAAFLGSGIEQLYPARHRGLYQDIVAGGGVVLSGFAPKATPLPRNFVIRNEWIAAVAELVCLVEAAERSGSLATVRHAARRKVPVAAFAGSPGANGLLAAGGARHVASASEIIAILKGIPVQPAQTPLGNPICDKVCAALTGTPQDEEMIAARAGLSVRDVVRALAALVASNQVMLLQGRRYTRPLSLGM